MSLAAVAVTAATRRPVLTHTLGFPRMGAQRALKFALEYFWRGDSTEPELQATAAQLRQQHWQAQADGLTDALKLAIGEHAGLAINGRPVATWKAAKDSTVTNWQAAANDIGALVAPDMLAATVARHTTTKPGSRRFLVK